MRLRRLLIGLSLALILAGSAAFLYAKSKSEPMNQYWFAKSRSGNHFVGESFFMTWRTNIRVEWISPLPVSMSVVRLDDLDGVLQGRGQPLLTARGASGKLTYPADRDGYYVLILEADVKDLSQLPLRGTVTMSYPVRPPFWTLPLTTGAIVLAVALARRGRAPAISSRSKA